MTPRLQITPEQLQELKDRNDCNAVAEKWVKLRRHGDHWIGQCPACSTDPDKPGTRFEVWPDHWVCAACEQGGDVIRLVMLREGRDFLGAVEWLGGTRHVDPAEAERRRKEIEGKREERERASALYREGERAELFTVWCECPRTIAGTSAERYLGLRGVCVPDTMRLRCCEERGFYIPVDGKKNAWRRIHTGPAMLAPLIGRDGKFAGLHQTYIDLGRPKGKAVILHPEKGDSYNAKKVRGSKKGSRIVLWEPPSIAGAPVPIEQLVLGEGIEKTAAVWMAYVDAGRDLSRTAFWVAGDIGNMGGKSDGGVRHPTLRTATGRVAHVPGPDPLIDAKEPGIPIPDTVTDLVLLGDSTSDRFTTACAMFRAQQRYGREGRTIRVAWAPDEMDFDDLVRAA